MSPDRTTLQNKPRTWECSVQCTETNDMICQVESNVSCTGEYTTTKGLVALCAACCRRHLSLVTSVDQSDRCHLFEERQSPRTQEHMTNHKTDSHDGYVCCASRMSRVDVQAEHASYGLGQGRPAWSTIDEVSKRWDGPRSRGTN